MNKKADGGLTAIIIILIVIVFLGWLININSRECSSNKDCKGDSYCGSDFSCHQYPAIQKNTVKVSLTLPIIIICITAIALTLILRWEKIFKRQPVKVETETSEPFYTSQTKATVK
ncbi:MAG: hypothetical protein KKC75_03410 [Nanoarchaeota archaeon]|nr:hypothetical protein [Nanoarchaeota archaeon]MBU1004730.1 hypothetical protein [Nanoarchaeota archaeon]MBU1945339.1 hypothetical protein [Nanoarchaeota archaeon]